MASLGFLWYSPTGATPPGKQEGEWRLLEPVSYENLTVSPVVSSSGYDTSAFLTLEEGLSSGVVTVREQGADAVYRNRDGSRPVAQNYGGAFRKSTGTGESQQAAAAAARGRTGQRGEAGTRDRKRSHRGAVR